MFQLIRLDTEEPIENEAGEVITFETGKEAAELAKALSEAMGVKCQPRRVVVDSSWHRRESDRIRSGEYERLAWENSNIWYRKVFNPIFERIEIAKTVAYIKRDDVYHSTHDRGLRTAANLECDATCTTLNEELKLLTTKHHFAHVALNDPMMIAFTKNDEMGLADRQTRIAPDVYLKRYWSEFLSDDDIATLVKIHFDTYGDASFKLASTPDEIEAVYTNYDSSAEGVSSSCMRGNNWPYGEHPCRVYGAGDLAIAYLTNDDGETTHRALCWPEKKLYSRMYGRGDKLHIRLKAAGYSKSRYYGESNASFEGARILKIEAECSASGVFIMPYFDEPANIVDDGSCFKMAITRSSAYSVHQTNGTTSSEPDEDDRDYCENCEENVYETQTVYTNNRRTRSIQMCECCRDNNAFYCDATDYFYSNRDVGAYEVGDQTWCEGYFEDHGSTSERSGDHFPADEMVTVIVDTDGTTEEWHQSEAGADAFEHNGAFYSTDIRDEILAEAEASTAA